MECLKTGIQSLEPTEQRKEKPSVVVHARVPRAEEVEAGGSQPVQPTCQFPRH